MAHGGSEQTAGMTLATAQAETEVQAGSLMAALVAALVTVEAGRGKQKV